MNILVQDVDLFSEVMMLGNFLLSIFLAKFIP